MFRKLIFTCVVASALALGGCVPWIEKPWGEHLEKAGEAAQQKKDYGTAAGYFKRAAKAGNAEAQYRLGQFYITGTGVDKSYADATLWLTKAAEQNHPAAQFALGRLVETGRGGDPDFIRALDLYTRAAKGGNADAQFQLGELVRRSISFEPFYKKDAESEYQWYKKAAAQGHIDAQYRLATQFYAHGNETAGVAEDRQQFNALKMAILSKSVDAANRGDAAAQYRLGIIYQEGYFDDEMDIWERFRKAEGWFGQAAEQHHADAENELGNIYCYGFVGDANAQTANTWYERAVADGSGEAAMMLGNYYTNGGTPCSSDERIDRNQAAIWYEKSARLGYGGGVYQFALYNLGLPFGTIYYGTAEWESVLISPDFAGDYVQGAKWLKIAVGQKFAPSYFPLSVLYSRGLGVTANKVEAERLLKEQAGPDMTPATAEIASESGPAAEAQMPVAQTPVVQVPTRAKGELSAEWLQGGLYGSDNEAAAIRKVTIRGAPGSYRINISNQFSFSCGITVNANGDPGGLENCVSTTEPDWTADQTHISLKCTDRKAERVCTGGYTLRKAEYSQPSTMTVARPAS